ncbi:MAG: insulinase family protein [archaeon]|nr:insulinase family protein [archaeon]
MIRHISDPNSRLNRFATGSIATLKEIPAAIGLNVRQALLDFHERHYTAGNMRLCILHSEAIEEVQAKVEKLFGTVRAGQPAAAVASTPFVMPFSPEKNLPKRVDMIPVKDKNVLQVLWPNYPSVETDYLSKSSNFLAHLLGHEGPGSILFVLKQKGWGNALYSGTTIDEAEFSAFSVQIELTEEGLSRVNDIVRLIYYYIGLIDRAAPQQLAELYREYGNMRQVDFNYSDPIPAQQAVISVVNSMVKSTPTHHLVAREHLLFSSYEEATPAIQGRLAVLRDPRNLLLRLISHNSPAECLLTVPHYGARYALSDPDPAFILDLAQSSVLGHPEPSNPDLYSGLKIVELNPFIPDHFPVLPPPEDLALTSASYNTKPELILQQGIISAWYVPDFVFRQPKYSLGILISSPSASASPSAYVCTSMVLFLLEDVINQYTYDATVAGLDYDTQMDDSGFVLSIKGFSAKLQDLLWLIFDAILQRREHTSHFERRFDDLKERLRQRFDGYRKADPRTHARTYAGLIRQERKFHFDRLGEVLPSMTLAMCLDYFDNYFLPHISDCRVLVHGNPTRQEAVTLAEAIHERVLQLKAQVTLPMLKHGPSLLSFRSVKLPRGKEIVYAAFPYNPSESNSAMYLAFQVGWDNARDHALVRLIGQILSPPIYDALRTKQQLGYIVWSDLDLELGVLYFYILIQSAVMTPDGLENASEEMLAACGPILEELSDERFQQYRSSLISMCTQPYPRMSDIFASTWAQITSRKFQRFGYRFELAQALASISKQDVLAFFQAHLAPSAHRRKLVVQIWPYGSQMKLAPSDHRIIVTDALDQWKSAQPLFPVPSPASLLP